MLRPASCTYQYHIYLYLGLNQVNTFLRGAGISTGTRWSNSKPQAHICGLLAYKEQPGSRSPSVEPSPASVCFSLAPIIPAIVVLPVVKHIEGRQLNSSHSCLFAKRI